MSYMWLNPGVALFYDIAFPAATIKGDKCLTILFLHGLGSSHCFYEGILPSLKDLQIPLRVIRVDMEGSGLSPLRSEWVNGRGSNQSIPGIADQTFEFLSQLTALDELPSMGFVIVGHSMGAITACEMAIASSERAAAGKKTFDIVGCVLIGPIVPSDAVANAIGQRIAIVSKGGMLPMADTIPKQATGSKATAMQRGFIRALLCGQDPAGYVSLCNAIVTASVPAYHRIPKYCPVLIIAGNEDNSASLEGCQYIKQEIGDHCQGHVLEGVGHWHCIEAPDEVGSLIVGFLNQIKS